MGKRYKRLTMKKYAKKYASVREDYNRLRGLVEEAEADNIITEKEATQIKQAKEEIVEETIAAVVDVVTEKASEVIDKVEEIVKATPKNTIKKKKPTRRPPTKRKKKKSKTEDNTPSPN